MKKPFEVKGQSVTFGACQSSVKRTLQFSTADGLIAFHRSVIVMSFLSTINGPDAGLRLTL